MKKQFLCIFSAVLFCFSLNVFAQTGNVPEYKRTAPQPVPKANSIKKSNPKETRELANIKKWEEIIIAAGDNQQYDTVEVYAGKILAIRSNNTVALYELGNSFKQRKIKIDSAKILFEQTIQSDQNHFRAYGDLASLVAAEGNYEKAIELAKKGIEVGTSMPGNLAVAYKNLGSYYFYTKKYSEAVEVLKKAVTLNPRYGNAYYDLGVTYQNLDKDSDAAEAYENALLYMPSNDKNIVFLYRFLVWYYDQKANNRTKALQYSQEGIKLDPYNVTFVDVIADKYRDDGNWYGYVELYKRVANYNQKDDGSAYAVGYGYQQLGNKTEALNWLKIAARRGNSNAQQMLRKAGISW